ncbi:putative response regulatory protein [compost metagenome]
MAKKAIHLGVSEYLLKPVDNGQLQEALEHAKKQVELKKRYEVIRSQGNASDEVLSAKLLGGQAGTSKVALQMMEYIQGNYRERISIQDLVNSLHISATSLNQKFKAETSYTFNEYLNRYRIQKAMDQLKTGEGKVYTIAMDTGFKDYRYFISIFKKYVNCTPSQFQERYRH